MKKRIVMTIAVTSLIIQSIPIYGDTLEDIAPEEVQVEEESKSIDSIEYGSYAEGRAIVYISQTSNTASTYARRENAYTMTDLMEIPDTENQDALETYGLEEATTEGKLVLVESDTLSTEQLISELEQQSGVVFAEPDYIVTASSVTNDTYVDKQWMLSGSTGSIGIESAWDNQNIGKGSEDIVVAVLDSGVDYLHEDLVDNMWSDKDDSSIHGYNAINGTYDPMDDMSHGTHVAGIIGAVGNNEIGVTGVNQDIQIMAVKFLDSNAKGLDSDAIKGMNYILQKKREGVNIVAVNNSWGGTGVSKSIKASMEALGSQGIISMNASGNESSNLEVVPDISGGILSQSVINVNAIDSDGNLAAFSNYGKTTTSICAPGVSIYSSIPTSMGGVYPEETPYTDTLQTFEQDAVDLNDWGLQNATENQDIAVSLSIDAIGCKQEDIVEGQHSQRVAIENAVAGQTAVFVTEPQDLSKYKDVADGFAFDVMATDEDNSQMGRYLYVSFMRKDKTWTQGYTITANYGIFGTIQVKFEDLNEESSQIDWENFQVRIIRNIVSVDEQGLEFHFDNLALSDASKTVNYTYMSGTSMAAPVITGAYALLAGSEKFKDEDSQKLRARILGGAVVTDELYDTCTTGGYISLTKAIENPSPVINETVQVRNEATIEGYFFGEESGQALINGTALEISAWSDESVTIQIPEGFAKASYEITIVRSDGERGRIFSWIGSEDESALYEKLENPDLESLGLTEELMSQYHLVSYENKIYRISTGVLNENGDPVILSYDTENKKWDIEATFPSIPIYSNSNWLAIGNKLYSYFVVQNIKEDGLEIYCTGKLVSYDLSSGKWNQLKLTEEGIEPVFGRSIVYNGEKIFMAGGYAQNLQDNNIIGYDSNVYSVDIETGEITEAGTLNQARYIPKLQMWNDELIVIGGTNEEGFVSEVEQGTVENLQVITTYPEVLENQQYELQTGLSDQGIFCVGMVAEGDNPSDTWIYNPDTYEFSEQSVRMGNGKFYNLGATVNNTYLYTAAIDAKTVNPVFMRMKIKNTKKEILSFMIDEQQAQIDEANHTIAITMPYGTDVTSLTPEITLSEGASVTPQSGETLDFTNPVEYVVIAEDGSTVAYKVTVGVQESSEYLINLSYSDGGTVTLSQMSAKEGTEITINAKPSEGYKVGDITVNGKLITGTTFTMPSENVGLHVNFEKLTYTITIAVEPSAGGSVNWTSQTVSYGDTVTMKATANSGYTFSKWTEGDTTVSTAATVTLQNVKKNHSYTAVFVQGTTTVTPTATPTSTTSTTDTTAAKTGDKTNSTIWFIVLALSGMSFVIFKKKGEKN